MHNIFKKDSKKKNHYKEHAINISQKTVINENYYRKDMDHTISNYNHYLSTNFNYAASTGSLYKNDIFENCSMYQTDFEFCLFEDCIFKSKKKIVSSFNCSDFVNSKFEDLSFNACTFTGTLFDKCSFSNVDIQSSTLENALFDNCSFKNTQLYKLNLNFAHFVNPKMENVVLSSEQIPFIFGIMKYLQDTNDNIKIASSNKLLSIDDYFDNEINLLIKKYNKQTSYDYKSYFPLANIYIAQGDYNEAQKALSKGIAKAVSIRDFRMIKFYCKLISETEEFDNNQRHAFYDLIKCFSNDNEKNSFTQRSFVRNIGEIESLLFSNKKNSNLKLRFLTNIHIQDSTKLQKIIENIFSISKMNYKGFSNEVEITLAQNSPLTITISISSEEDNIYYLLEQFIAISNNTVIADGLKSNSLKEYNPRELCENTTTLINFCSEREINLTILEYFIENVSSTNNIPNYYFARTNNL